MMLIGKKLSLMIFVLCCCVGCDQATKELAQHTLRNSDTISWCHDLFRLQYAENPGGFLSLGSKLPQPVRFWILLVLPGGLLLMITVWLMVSPTIPYREMFALLLIVGGGGSNLFDRLYRAGKAIDFMNIGIGAVRTGIFNVADVAIMIGIGLLILSKVHDMIGEGENCP
jgi:signal peptidase II